ncbi:MAG: 30S ribosomal protein S4 [Candidatus Dojkabacteria bacterium]|jgi:small subunit ribosomal protein S4|nr:MAG: 30S ribosomal protein S4 [Candidatus Dojkabacteria bacterium]
MARITKGKYKLCRRERYDLFPRVGDQSQSSKRLKRRTPPGEHPIYPRMSQYAVQFREKQKVKRIYGMLERQFRRFFEMASKKEGETGLALLQLLELRLDNFLFRAGLAKTRDQARQLVNHGHVLVDGRKVDVPSYLLKVGQTVKLVDKICNLDWYEEIKRINESYVCPSWISRQSISEASVARIPSREDMDQSINVQYIVEFYSK